MPIPLPAGLFFAHEVSKQILQIEAEARLRYEQRQDRDFAAGRADARTDLHQRYRIGVQWKPHEGLKGVLQYQYAHTSMRTPARNGTDESSDLLQANLQWTQGARTLTVGRQRINQGSERLMGSLEWVNTARAYDGVRYQDAHWDLFVARIGVQAPLPAEARIAGASVKSRFGETALYFKHDATAAGSLDLWTLAHTARVNWGATSFEGEFAYQAGRNLGRNHQAWAYHLQLSKTLNPQWTGALEWNSASGGGTDGTSRTFDNLYPTNHKFYGVMDMFGWRNLDQLQGTGTYRPRPDIEVKARISSSWLHDQADAWYGAAGRPNEGPAGPFRDPSGNSGRHLGWEFDLEGTWKRNPRETLSGGVGIFAPGHFVRKLAGSPRNQVFFFMQYAIKF